MNELIYLSCFLSSLTCAVLLFRGYGKSRSLLLLWSAICFCALAVNNVLLFIDLALVPQVDLSIARNMVGLLGVILLLYGLIWEVT